MARKNIGIYIDGDILRILDDHVGLTLRFKSRGLALEYAILNTFLNQKKITIKTREVDKNVTI